MKILKNILIVYLLAALLLPALAYAQTSTLDAGGMIDEGGIMTNREQEQASVKKIFDEQGKEDKTSEYWLSVTAIIIGTLFVFELGLKLGSKKKTDS